MNPVSPKPDALQEFVQNLKAVSWTVAGNGFPHGSADDGPHTLDLRIRQCLPAPARGADPPLEPPLDDHDGPGHYERVGIPDRAGDGRDADVLLQALSGSGVPVDQGHSLRGADGTADSQPASLVGQHHGAGGDPAHGEGFLHGGLPPPARVQLAELASACW